MAFFNMNDEMENSTDKIYTFDFDILLDFVEGNLDSAQEKKIRKHLQSDPVDWQIVQGIPLQNRGRKFRPELRHLKAG